MWSIIASIVGLAGSILVTFGVFRSNSDSIAQQSLEYQEFNPNFLINTSKQRAEIFLGVILIVLAFLVQITAQIVLLLDDAASFSELVGLGFVVVAVGCFGYFGNKLAGKISVKRAKKAAAKWIFLFNADMFRDEEHRKYKGEILSYRSTEEIAKELCNFSREDKESKEDFTNRFIKYLKIEQEIPDIMQDKRVWQNIVKWAWE